MRLEVENRHDFTDLSELRFEWKLDKQSGVVATSAPPGAKGILEIPVAEGTPAGELLEVRAVSPRGFVEDVWQVALGVDPRIAPPVPAKTPGVVKLEKTSDAFVIRGADFVATVDAKTGAMKATGKNGKPSLLSRPDLLLLPLNDDMCGGMQLSGPEREIPIFTDTCHDWKATAVTAKETDSGVEIRIQGEYAEAKGAYTLSFGNDGTLSLHYSFTVTERGKCDPRQIGVVFDCPPNANRFPGGARLSGAATRTITSADHRARPPRSKPVCRFQASPARAPSRRGVGAATPASTARTISVPRR